MNILSSKSNLISITPSALDRLQILIDKAQEDIKAIKLGVKNGGCAETDPKSIISSPRT